MGLSRHVSAITLLLFAGACTSDRTLGPTPVADGRRRVPAAISLVSGNEQPAKAGETLAQPLVVRVTDSDGNPVGGVIVLFRVASGRGVLAERCEDGAQAVGASIATDPNGVAEVTFQPTVLGQSVVTAQLPGSRSPPVIYQFEASVLVIEFWAGIWNFGFIGPCPFSSDVTIPVGTAVEWRVPVHDERYPITYSVTSTSTPPGAAGFDSGNLTDRDRFHFVPPVAGKWAYRDRVSGLTGTLTAN